jgi:hypothetical protein
LMAEEDEGGDGNPRSSSSSPPADENPEVFVKVYYILGDANAYQTPIRMSEGDVVRVSALLPIASKQGKLQTIINVPVFDHTEQFLFPMWRGKRADACIDIFTKVDSD